MRILIAISLSVIWLFSGCTGDLPSASKIDKLRVLAISADQPEVGPGTQVKLEALVVNPNGTELTYNWYACFADERGNGFFGGGGGKGASGGKGYGLDDPGSCKSHFEAGTPFAQFLGNSESATVKVPADLLDNDNVAKAYQLPPGQLPDFALDVIREVAGVNYMVTLIVTTESERVEAYKRINVSTNSAPNKNPEGFTFYLAPTESSLPTPAVGTPPSEKRCFVGEEQTPPVLDASNYTITALNIPNPQEIYSVLVGDIHAKQPLTTNEETWFYSYFSTHGDFEREIVKSTGDAQVNWKLDAKEEGPVSVWIVVRDGRGGTAWCHSKF